MPLAALPIGTCTGPTRIFVIGTAGQELRKANPCSLGAKAPVEGRTSSMSRDYPKKASISPAIASTSPAQMTESLPGKVTPRPSSPCTVRMTG